ncbi:hypothetical protein [Brasilonema bromeliae]|uniref:hypothetical protein n=1 Tax=Brasilonema bromeliae TaxID=383615 RepID=UPI00145EB9C3
MGVEVLSPKYLVQRGGNKATLVGTATPYGYRVCLLSPDGFSPLGVRFAHTPVAK